MTSLLRRFGITKMVMIPRAIKAITVSIVLLSPRGNLLCTRFASAQSKGFLPLLKISQNSPKVSRYCFVSLTQ
jgi:hypothetical protein